MVPVLLAAGAALNWSRPRCSLHCCCFPMLQGVFKRTFSVTEISDLLGNLSFCKVSKHQNEMQREGQDGSSLRQGRVFSPSRSELPTTARWAEPQGTRGHPAFLQSPSLSCAGLTACRHHLNQSLLSHKADIAHFAQCQRPFACPSLSQSPTPRGRHTGDDDSQIQPFS